MMLFAATKTMVGLDWTMVGLFFFVLILIPTLASRKGASSSKEFFLSGRSMPWWLLGISMVAATTSTNSANLFTELIRDKGGISGNWKWWAFLLTGMLTVFVYAKLWRRSGVTTDIEFYELRYSGKPAAFLRCFRGLYLGVLFNLIVMAFVTLGAVKIGVIVFGVDPWLIYVVTTVSAIVYAAFGGLRGMVYTDLFLFALVMVGAVVSMVFALGHVGGLHALVTHAAVTPKLNFFPDFAHADTDLLIMIFIIPLAVQWWNVWWPGSEPGGGGYIVQRMLSAKNENHAVGAALFVGLASIIVFPQLADIRTAFPNVDPSLVGHDMAYPAMMTVIPSGWYGLTVASLMGALFSTLAAHINMGASYIVNDFYRRFVRPQAGERELVFAGRAASVVLIVTACALAPFMQSARVAMDLTMLIGAGTGPIFLLRWFWMRINAWSEVAGMVSSFLAAAFLLAARGLGAAPRRDRLHHGLVAGGDVPHVADGRGDARALPRDGARARTRRGKGRPLHVPRLGRDLRVHVRGGRVDLRLVGEGRGHDGGLRACVRSACPCAARAEAPRRPMTPVCPSAPLVPGAWVKNGDGLEGRNSPLRIEFWKQPEQLSKTTLPYGHTLNVLSLGIVIA